MFQIHRLRFVFTMFCIGLSACAAPTAPASTLAPTATTLLLTETPAVVATSTLAPTATPEATAKPETETITFMRSGVIETTTLKKDTITFNLPNGETIIMPKIQMVGVEPGYNVDKLVEKALEFIAADSAGVACGVLRQPDKNYKPNDPNDPYSRYRFIRSCRDTHQMWGCQKG